MDVCMYSCMYACIHVWMYARRGVDEGGCFGSQPSIPGVAVVNRSPLSVNVARWLVPRDLARFALGGGNGGTPTDANVSVTSAITSAADALLQLPGLCVCGSDPLGLSNPTASAVLQARLSPPSSTAGTAVGSHSAAAASKA